MESESVRLYNDFGNKVDAMEGARSKIVETIKKGIKNPGYISIEKDKIQIQIEDKTSFILDDLIAMTASLSANPLHFEFKLKNVKNGVMGVRTISYLIISEF